MHSNAQQWDDQHSLHSWSYVPHGRPCDWCGLPVEEGFIHSRCVVLELRRMGRVPRPVVLPQAKAPAQPEVKVVQLKISAKLQALLDYKWDII